MRKFLLVVVAACASVLWVSAVSASTPGADVRLTNDCHPLAGCGAGYVSAYTLGTGNDYTDATLDECTISRGRQNEPAVAIDPRDPMVVLGSSNDYCGVYNQTDAAGNPVPAGPIWEGYYRSEDGGANFTSSLVPGYPDDASPYGLLAKQQVRTASAGDPVIAWDGEGRAFFGAESSDDPAGTPKTFGDVWVARFVPASGEAAGDHPDGKAYAGTTVVAHGSSAPNLLGKFNDKTAIEADHNSDGRCDNNVYFSWSRFSGNAGGVAIYFARSTNHGATFTSPKKISQTISDVQFPDIAITGNDDVYLFFRSFASGRGHEGDEIYYVKSTDCGATFTRPILLTSFIRSDAKDVSEPEPVPAQTRPDDPLFGEEEAVDQGLSRDCGDFADHCESGYTFFRRDTQERATADQFDPDNQYVYVVYDATKPGTEDVSTGTSYYTTTPGHGGQAAIFFTRLDGATGEHTTPAVIDDQALGHQIFPDVSADNPTATSRGTVHAIWWDSRNDECYSPARPIGNCDDRSTTASLDAWGAVSHDFGASWPTSSRLSDVSSNPNYEQFDNRAVPFAGDYLYVSSLDDFAFGTWTDWRDTVAGTDPRELPEDEDAGTADVHQCREFSEGEWSGDLCPHEGGLDQNIYGDLSP
jgi:hypothetical protein